ncbi:MAG TPA: hypothetical protein VGU46_05550 [Acidobacteriaceae bacterium]|nr:hypothetical protein [Acidobacteriaceae bacterium]
MRLILLLLFTTSVAGAQQVAVTKVARTSPWFNAQTINFVALTPAPPASGSRLDQQDMQVVLLAQRTRTSSQIQQAQADDKEEDIFIFESILGPKFNAAELPFTTALSQDLRDASAIVNPSLKLRFGRRGPFLTLIVVVLVAAVIAGAVGILGRVHARKQLTEYTDVNATVASLPAYTAAPSSPSNSCKASPSPVWMSSPSPAQASSQTAAQSTPPPPTQPGAPATRAYT